MPARAVRVSGFYRVFASLESVQMGGTGLVQTGLASH
jgi:hypothetical protein